MNTTKLDIEKQVKAIRLTLVRHYADTCNTCNFEYVSLVTINGEKPCPKCDSELICQALESVKEAC